MSILVSFKDIETGCELGYIGTTNYPPLCAEIESALNSEMLSVANLRPVGEMITSDTASMVLVKFTSYWNETDSRPQVGLLTYFKSHARKEAPGEIFLIS